MDPGSPPAATNTNGVSLRSANSAVFRPRHANNVRSVATSSSRHRPQLKKAHSWDKLYVSEMTNHTVRRIMPDWVVTTVAGTALNSGATNGTGPNASFCFPRHTAVDNAGNIYVADFRNYTIRKGWAAGTTPIISLDRVGPAHGQVSVAFHLVTGSTGSFTLLWANDAAGPWSPDGNALCTTNVPEVSYQFATPMVDPVRLFRVRTP